MSLRVYEALIILKAIGSEKSILKAAEQLAEPVRRLGGKLESSQSLGRRRLTFRIARQAEGYYHLVRFQIATQKVKELERLYRLNEAIIRFMIISDNANAKPESVLGQPAASTTGS